MRGDNYPNPYFLKALCEYRAFSFDWFYLAKVSGLPVAVADNLLEAATVLAAEEKAAIFQELETPQSD